MKLRYYLRGLGTGILVTALILGRLISQGRPLTDAEIKAKALTLGMVDENSLSLSNVDGSGSGPQDSLETVPGSESPKPEAAFEPEADESPGTDPADEPNPEITDSPEPVTSSAPSPTPEETQSPGPSQEMTTPESEPVESIAFEIFYGDTSSDVCRRLEEAGLVEDAWEFDRYLVDNGYATTLRTGTYSIPADASWEEIIDIIT